jgi:hypothetical protein
MRGDALGSGFEGVSRGIEPLYHTLQAALLQERMENMDILQIAPKESVYGSPVQLEVTVRIESTWMIVW